MSYSQVTGSTGDNQLELVGFDHVHTHVPEIVYVVHNSSVDHNKSFTTKFQVMLWLYQVSFVKILSVSKVGHELSTLI
jgi:hypothetical protein